MTSRAGSSPASDERLILAAVSGSPGQALGGPLARFYAFFTQAAERLLSARNGRSERLRADIHKFRGVVHVGTGQIQARDDGCAVGATSRGGGADGSAAGDRAREAQRQAPSHQPPLDTSDFGTVYTATNDPNGNAVVLYTRNANGTLTQGASFPTGGKGIASEPPSASRSLTRPAR